MTLHAIEGHGRLRTAISRAFEASELPTVLLLHGVKGVGKQRLALWTGQRLLCEGSAGPEPCGECRGCRLALRLEHPDLLWYFPVKRPPSKGSRERDQQSLEDARRELLEQAREKSVRPSYSAEPLGLHLGTVRNLKKEAMRGSGMAPRRLFVLGEAQELVSQEASPEAANALLKLLEEPPPNCWFVLTSSEPGRLLPTLRSRTTAIHVPPLSNARVSGFLERHGGAAGDEIGKATDLAGGSIGRALGFLTLDRETGPLERIRKEAFQLLRAALSPRPADRFARALSYSPAGARGLHELFSSLETWLRDLAALASTRDAALLNQDASDWLSKTVADLSIEPLRVALCIKHVEDSRRLAAANVNPQLILNLMLDRLREELAESSVLATDEVS